MFFTARFHQIQRIMRLLTIFLLCGALSVSARTYSQRVTCHASEVKLDKIFSVIEEQTGYYVVYNATVIQRMPLVSVRASNLPLPEFLNEVLRDLPLQYSIEGKTISVRTRAVTAESQPVAAPAVQTLPINVRGRVVSEKGEPLAGATVMVKGTKRSTVTGTDGVFVLEAEAGQTLVVSYVGYESAGYKITPEDAGASGRQLNIPLKQAVTELDESVVVAYGKTTQRANTGAVTVVKGEQIATLPNRSFDKSLQGLVPGLAVTSGNGQPGSAPGNFVLRGIASGGAVNTGQTVRNPLIVIDGIPVSQDPTMNPFFISQNSSAVSNPMAQLNPSDIESISVLKDASAIALYGSKASNGVILVTTKKGKQGKTSFNFRHQSDFSSPLEGKLRMLNQKEYLELLFEAYRNSFPGITDADILADLRSSPSPIGPKFPTIVNTPGDTSFYPQDNWYDKLVSKTAYTMTNELSISGGNERSLFYLNMEYLKQDGVVKNTGYDRKSLRFNYENRPAKWLKFGINQMLSYNQQDYGADVNIFAMQAISPLNPIYGGGGKYIYNYSWGLDMGSLTPNPIAASELNINSNTTYRSLSKLYAELKLLQNLSFTSTLGVDYLHNDHKLKVHPLLATEGTLDYHGKLTEESFQTSGIITNNVLQFDQTINKDHSIHVLLGQEAQINVSKNSFILGYSFANNPSLDHIAGIPVQTAGTITGKQTLLSYFGQVNYSFLNRYFLSGSARTDGASNFGDKQKFGTFWSIGGGWVVSDEPFLRILKRHINFIKLRGSFGPAGNSAAIVNSYRYDYLGSMVQYLGGTAVAPSTSRTPGNPAIQWENTFAWNAGLDLKLLNNRISMAADIYKRKTHKLIATNVPLALTTGFQTITTNVGDVSNSGIELSVSADVIKNASFSWRLSANWSRNKNTFVKSYIPRNATSYFLTNEVGKEYNSFYLPVWAGVNPANGRPTWIDSTGKPTEDYNMAPRQIAGKPQPDGFGSIINSFGWKGIELALSIYYSYGSQVYTYGVIQNDGLNPYINQSTAALDRWQKPGDIASNPRRLIQGMAAGVQDMGYQPSTRYLADGDYVRLSNVSIGYSFSSKTLQHLHLSGLRIFVQGHNLATWTRYSGQDPENVTALGGGDIIYPQQKSYSAGVNVSF